MWLLFTLVGQGLLSTVQAFKPGAFAMPVDLNDHYFSVGPDFSRENGTLICPLEFAQCARKICVMYPSNTYPVCITGSVDRLGPLATGMTLSESQKSLLSIHGKWCWDTPVRYASGLNISGISRLIKLEVIVEPTIPSGFSANDLFRTEHPLYVDGQKNPQLQFTGNLASGNSSSLNIYLPDNTVGMALKGLQPNRRIGQLTISFMAGLMVNPAYPGLINQNFIPVGREGEAEDQLEATMWQAALKPMKGASVSIFTNSPSGTTYENAITSVVFYSYEPKDSERRKNGTQILMDPATLETKEIPPTPPTQNAKDTASEPAPPTATSKEGATPQGAAQSAVNVVAVATATVLGVLVVAGVIGGYILYRRKKKRAAARRAGINDTFEIDPSNEVKPLDATFLSPNGNQDASTLLSPPLTGYSALTPASSESGSSVSGKGQPLRVRSPNILFERDAGVVESENEGDQGETVIMPPSYDPSWGASRSESGASSSQGSSARSASMTKRG